VTKKRYDNNSTQFGLWLREQACIDSHLGFVATNLDYIWCNYKTGQWMILEEKRYGASVKFYQKRIFDKIDKLCSSDSLYRGFHTIVFENTNPADGKIFIDNKEVNTVQLLHFLRFEI